MPVALDGICFGIALWLISSIFVCSVLGRHLKGDTILTAVLGLGVMSFGAFLLYEWLVRGL